MVSRRVALCAALAGLFLSWSAARDLQPFDSAEFVLNAAQLGVGHPPGQPAYLLLGALLVRALPISPAMVFAATAGPSHVTTA